MGTEEEVLRLEIQTDGAEKLDDVAAKIDRLRDAQGRFVSASGNGGKAGSTGAAGVYELADAYEVLGDEMQSVFTTASQIPRAFDWTKIVSPQVKQLKTDFDFATLSMEKVSPITGKAAAGTRDLGFAALQASRGIEDMQYGFAGVINNIPGVVMAMGGGAGLTAAISLASVAAYQFSRHWGDLAGLFQDRNPVPGATTSLEGMEKALGKTNDALSRMRDATSLSNAELAEFNRLTAEKIKLEAHVEQAKQTKDLEQSKGAAQKERAKQVQGVIDDLGGPQVLADVKAAFVAKYGSGGDVADTDRAQRLVLNAKQGRSAAVEELMALFAEGYGGKDNRTGRAIRGTDVAAPLKGEPVQFDPATQAAMAKARAAMDKEEADRAKERDDVLNKQGEQNEKPALKDLAEATKAEKATKTAQEKADDAAFDAEAARVAKRHDDEVKRINSAVGEPYQQQFERDMAVNAAARMQGLPSMDPAALKRQLMQQMYRAMRQRGATPAAATEATKAIAEKGQGDLTKKMAQLGGAGLNVQQATMQAMEATQIAVDKFATRLIALENKGHHLGRNAEQLNRRARQHQPSPLAFGGPQ